MTQKNNSFSIDGENWISLGKLENAAIQYKNGNFNKTFFPETQPSILENLVFRNQSGRLPVTQSQSMSERIIEHTITKEDTPESISARYYDSADYGEAILLYNGISNRAKLSSKKELSIPSLQTLKRFSSLLKKEKTRAGIRSNFAIVQTMLSKRGLSKSDRDYQLALKYVKQINDVIQQEDFNPENVAQPLKAVKQLLVLRDKLQQVNRLSQEYGNLYQTGVSLNVEGFSKSAQPSFNIPASSAELLTDPDQSLMELIDLQKAITQNIASAQAKIAPIINEQYPAIKLKTEISALMTIVSNPNEPITKREKAFNDVLNKYEALVKAVSDTELSEDIYDFGAKLLSMPREGKQTFRDASLRDIENLRGEFNQSKDKAVFLNNQKYVSRLTEVSKRNTATEFVDNLRGELRTLMEFQNYYLFSAGKAIFKGEQREAALKEITGVIQDYRAIMDILADPKVVDGMTAIGPQTGEDFQSMLSSDRLGKGLTAYQELMSKKGSVIQSLFERAATEPHEFPTKGDLIGIVAGVGMGSIFRLDATRMGITSATTAGKITLSGANALGFVVGARTTNLLIDQRSPYRTDSQGAFLSDFSKDFALTWMMFGAFNLGSKA